MKMMVMRRPSWSTGRLCCSRSESGKLVRSDGGGAGLLGDATSVMHHASKLTYLQQKIMKSN